MFKFTTIKNFENSQESFIIYHHGVMIDLKSLRTNLLELFEFSLHNRGNFIMTKIIQQD